MRLWDEARAQPLEHLDPRAPAFAADLSRCLEQVPPEASAVLSSVAAAEVEASVAAALVRRFGDRFRGEPDPGLEIVCRNRHTIGSDRLFAARGAAESLGASALVIDAGTALTVDAVEVLAGQRARFLGGAIAPGPALLARALAGAAKLHRVEPRPAVPALGQDTPAALHAGITVGFRGAALELVRRIGEESGLGHGLLALCGGARAFLLEPTLFPADARVCVLPDLVHAGLAAAAGIPAARVAPEDSSEGGA